jgi:hypothetical protein
VPLHRTGGGRYSPRPLRARLVRLPPRPGSCRGMLLSISSLDVGTVVQVFGTCGQAGPVRMMETSTTYACAGGGGCGFRFSVHAKLGHIEQRPPRAVCLPLMGREGGWKVWDCSWF